MIALTINLCKGWIVVISAAGVLKGGGGSGELEHGVVRCCVMCKRIHMRQMLIVPSENGKLAVSSLDICFHCYKILKNRPCYQVKYII